MTWFHHHHDNPPKRPPTPSAKHKQSTAAKTKFNLTKVQRVQVEIIDGKRCSVRSLLIIAHVTLIHLIAYLIVLGFGYSLISKSTWLMISYYGFFLDLGLYFFGSGAALKAVTYAWRPCRFCLGILAILLGMTLNVALYFLGTARASQYRNKAIPVNISDADCRKHSGTLSETDFLCKEIPPVKIALTVMPFILPPLALICVIIATISAYKAVYVTPLKLNRGQVDAVWLEPYETYDFYIGRYIPKVPGYDEKFEDVNTTSENYGGEEDSLTGSEEGDLSHGGHGGHHGGLGVHGIGNEHRASISSVLSRHSAAHVKQDRSKARERAKKKTKV